MNINISDRIVLIVGPTSSGKTTFAKRIKSLSNFETVIISHDEVLSKVDKHQSQEKIDMDFRLLLLSEINTAIKNKDIKLIILDTLNITNNALFAVLNIIKVFFNYSMDITLIKFDIPLQLHLDYCKNREIKTGKTADAQTLMNQKTIFASPNGSLNSKYSFCHEYIITNPEETTISFDNVI